MIKLHLADQDMNVVVWDYDQHTSRFYDEDGTDLYFNSSVANQIWPEAFKVSPETPGKKTQKVKKLKIQLGLGCNFSCSYCLQGTEIAKASATSTNDANIFLKKIDSWLDPEQLEKIEFWGGEPLLYWKKLEILVPALREKFPNLKFSTISNGSLLTKEIIDQLNEWNFSIGISHDGPGQSVRGPDPLDDPQMLETWKYLFATFPRRSSINSVMTPISYDPLEIMKWFRNKFQNNDIMVNFEGVVHDYNGDQAASFTPEQLHDLTSCIVTEMLDGSLTEVPSFKFKMRDIIESFRQHRPSSALGQKCGMDSDTSLSVDLLGNVSTCQNTGTLGEHRLGSVLAFDNIKLDTSYHWSFRKECPTCPVLQLCKGSCMYQTGKQWANSCNAEYAYNLAFFMVAIHLYTGRYVVGIEGNIIRPAAEEVVNESVG